MVWKFFPATAKMTTSLPALAVMSALKEDNFHDDQRATKDSATRAGALISISVSANPPAMVSFFDRPCPTFRFSAF